MSSSRKRRRERQVASTVHDRDRALLNRSSVAASHNLRPFSWQVLAVASIALLVRLAYIWQISSSPFFDTLIGDARQYDAWGRQIAAGDWIGRDVFYQAPLYPYFLGTIYLLSGHSFVVVRICQAIVGAAACALLAVAGARIYSRGVGLIAGAGLAVYAPVIFFDGVLQKSVLDVFFICLLLWLLSLLIEQPNRRLRWFALGVSLGALALTRENALLLAVPVVLWQLRRSRNAPVFSCVALFLLGLTLVLSPVAIRNRLVGGEWHLTTSQFGPNFYLGNNPTADGTAAPLRQGRGTAEYERQDATDLAQTEVGRTLTPGEVSNFWANKAVAFIGSHPVTWLKLEVTKAMLLWNRAELVDTDSQESYEEWSSVLRVAALFGNFGVLAPLAAFGVLVRWGDRQRLWLYYAMAGTYAVSVLLFYVSARYRLPLVPFLMLFAAAGLSSARDFFRTNETRNRVAIAVIVTAAAILANWQLWPPGSMRAVTENNLGNALQQEGKFEQAESHYKRAIAIRPDYAPAYINLGAAMLAQGRAEEAITSYQRASTLVAIDPELDAKLGNAFLKAGKPSQAIEYFRRSLAAGHATVEIHNNLAAALIETNQWEEAIATLKNASQLDPRNGILHFRIGTLLLEHDRARDAVPEFRAGVGLVPDSAEGHSNFGAALAASGHPEDAISEFESAIRLNPDLKSAHRNLAIARQALARR